MSLCEKCWADAALEAAHTSADRITIYRRLLEERKATPCSIAEQSGTPAPLICAACRAPLDPANVGVLDARTYCPACLRDAEKGFAEAADRRAEVREYERQKGRV